MKKIIFTIIFLAASVAFWYFKYELPKKSSVQVLENNIKPMQISSPSFLEGKSIPAKYTCDGEGVNPPLQFSDIPAEAKSLALIVDDPDAPGAPPAGGWVHWVLWNMDPRTDGVAENSTPPKALQGQTSSGQNVYGGPCPPDGQHRYFFKLFALDTKISLPTYSLVADLEKAMEGHILKSAQLIGVYGRGK